MTPKYSPLESERFSLEVYRLDLDHVDVTKLRDVVAGVLFDLLIIRVPAGDAATVQRALHPQHCTIHADTLIYYERMLAKLAFPASERPGHCELKIVRGDPSMRSELELAAYEIFMGYRSHYCARADFSVKAIALGYAQWAEKLLTSEEADVMIATVESKIVGFLAWSANPDMSIASIELNGVLPEYRRLGVYSALLRSVVDIAQSRGFTRLQISTQAHNIEVQRVWCKAAFLPIKALDTLHVERATL